MMPAVGVLALLLSGCFSHGEEPQEVTGREVPPPNVTAESPKGLDASYNETRFHRFEWISDEFTGVVSYRWLFDIQEDTNCSVTFSATVLLGDHPVAVSFLTGPTFVGYDREVFWGDSEGIAVTSGNVSTEPATTEILDAATGEGLLRTLDPYTVAFPAPPSLTLTLYLTDARTGPPEAQDSAPARVRLECETTFPQPIVYSSRGEAYGFQMGDNRGNGTAVHAVSAHYVDSAVGPFLTTAPTETRFVHVGLPYGGTVGYQVSELSLSHPDGNQEWPIPEQENQLVFEFLGGPGTYSAHLNQIGVYKSYFNGLIRAFHEEPTLEIAGSKTLLA